MALKITNNAISKLAAAIGTTDTQLTLNAGDGGKFPVLGSGDWHPLTLVKSDGTFEIVKVTARANDTLTVVRAQDATVATTFSIGDKAELRMTAGAFQQLMTDTSNALTAAENAQATANGKLDQSAQAADSAKLGGLPAANYAQLNNANFNTLQKGGVDVPNANGTIANSTQWDGAHKTVSTAAPSGGVNGDIWMTYS